jgi:hypothetical protein
MSPARRDPTQTDHPMRADIQQQADDIKESLALLRRYL